MLRDTVFNPLKLLHHADRLRALAEGRDVAPVTVEIDPVAWCNHACGWCVDPVHRKIEMPLERYERLIDELEAFRIDGRGVEGVVLKGGGEPTLHPRFGELVERAARRFAVGVVTNGSRLDRWAGVLAERAAYVRISLDGPTPESHARVHGSRDFARVLDGVRALVAARRGDRPVLGATFAMDADTVDLADEAVRLSTSLGLDYVLLRPPFFEEVGARPTMSVEQRAAVRRSLAAVAARHPGGIELYVGQWTGDAEQIGAGLEASGRRDMATSALPIEHRTGRCLASPLLAVVTADGQLYGCCNLRALPDWSMGSVEGGFAAAWAGEKRRETLDRMHRTACIRYCTHPLSRYNEAIEALGGSVHREFV